MHDKLQSFIDEHKVIIEESLSQIMSELDAPESLKSSMAYSINAGGKRIRPLLVLATLEDLKVNCSDALKVACAVELIHTYSLIHDDLPSMDDDDFRRGSLTNHKVYGEAVAILAGDGLQALAFELLTKLTDTPPQLAIELIGLLSKASGAEGMVGGQILDIEGERKQLSLIELENVHINKTGALLSFCVEAGAVLATIPIEDKERLMIYAKNIGLAFQIQDDILDVTASTEELGKTAGSDETSEKMTYPALLGLEKAKERLGEHHRIARESLEFLNNDESLLGHLADYIVERRY
ncbi:polyprenyl synthetase family protein [Sporosarcina siberiensis]|uniref:Polyprenyl synthetase family protein n=1 Tax=Sporosarcina siberiensis TaxID=1365606 RepID=A0ABW4SBH2_9BACL